MTHSAPARTTTRRIPWIPVGGLLAVIAANAVIFRYPILGSSSSTAESPIDVVRSEQRRLLGEADGVVPDGTTVFDDAVPGVANLNPALLGALRKAATDAAADMGASAAAWLAHHGATYGLCQIYSNEPWHFELRPEAVRRGCPAMYADPTHDPTIRGQR